MSALPPAGWYDDPEHPGYLRYWDGSVWTDHRAPAGGTSGTQGLTEIGALLSGAFRLLWARKVPLAIMGAIVLVVFGIVGGLLAWAVNDLVYVDGDWQGVYGDRFALVSIAAVVAILVGLAVFTGVVHQLYWARFGIEHTAASSLNEALKITPRVMLWGLAVIGLFIAAIMALVILGLISPVLAVLAGLAFIPFSVWAWVKLSFFLVALVAPVPGQNPIKSSASVSANGRFWAVFGRLALVAIISGAIAYVAGIPFGAAAGGDFDDIVVTDGAGEILYFHVGDFLGELGFSGGLIVLLSAIPQALGSLLTVAGSTWIYADVNGRVGG